jgi:hypothetical protein
MMKIEFNKFIAMALCSASLSDDDAPPEIF